MSVSVLDLNYAGFATHSLAIVAHSSAPQTNGDRERSEHPSIMQRVLRSVEEDTWVSVSNPGTLLAVLRGMLSQSASSVAVSLSPVGTQASGAEQPALPPENVRALALIDKWLADESGYDEEVWPVIKRDIEENRLSDRKRFG
jgi:hypothetical protein